MSEQERKNQIIQWVVTGILLGLGFYNQLAQIKGWAHFEVGDAVLTRYVTWFYELIVGAWAFWHNNNITSFAQLVQLVLDALKNGTINPTQVENLLTNPVVQKIANGVDVSEEQLNMFLLDKDLQDVVQAEIDGKDVEVMIDD